MIDAESNASRDEFVCITRLISDDRYDKHAFAMVESWGKQLLH